MAKRLTKDGWRALGVYNSHDICKRGGRGVYVAYVAADNGRMAMYARWR